MRATWSVAISVVLTLCIVGLGPGCAQEVGLIDRTQAGLLKKSIFEGEWFMRRTVIDVPYDVGYTFIGEQEEAVRIRWDVQKDLLVAYRSHPFIENTPQSAPVAAFSIKAHVDVIRDYNTATGEQTNVLVENTTDRMWFERDHIRIDWSKNLLTNFNFYIDQLSLEPVALYIEDDDDPDRLLLGSRGEDGGWIDVQDQTTLRDMDDAEYIDVVTQVFVKPEEILIEDWDGTVYAEPACWYYLNSDCAPAVVSVRNAFLRVDAALTDYEPLHFPDNQVLRDDDDNAIRVRWNASGDRERATTNDAPQKGGTSGTPAGSGPSNPYDTGEGTNAVRLPMFDKFGFFRTERYGYDSLYGELESNREFWINRWNIWDRSHDADGNALPYAERGARPIVYYLSPGFPAALRETAQEAADQWDAALRETVTALAGSDPGRMFDLRDNTRQIDPETGAVVNRGEVIGDLRYSHIYYVDKPLRVGLLGYGPAAIDPLTGEIFQADAFIYGEVVKQVAAKGRDIVDLLNGRLDPDEVSSGANVQRYLSRLQTDPRSRAPSRAEISEFARTHRGAGPDPEAPRKKARSDRRPARATPQSLRNRPGIDKLRRPRGWADSRLNHVRDTPVEDMLMSDPEIARAVGAGRVDPAALGTRDPAARAQLSPLRWASPNHKRQQMARFRSFTSRNMLMATFVDDAVAGTAQDLKDTPSDDIVDILSAHIFRSTTEHEVGHTLGLRHNFEASTDALNYHPEYWDLRGDNPRPMARMSETERDGRLREFQYSSIMDYHGRFNTDTAGLGYYDVAAIKFGYGQLVEVFDHAPEDKLLDLTTYDDGSHARQFTLDEVLRGYRHYTKIPQMFGGRANLAARRTLPYTRRSAALMGQPETASYEARLTGDAPWDAWEVPYRFCSDEYVGASGTCHAFDLGADSYEIVQDTIDRYRAYYWFNNFKRDQVFFDEWSYQDAMWWRYFSFLHNAYQNWVFDQWFDGDTWAFLRDDPDSYGIEDVPWTEAVDGGAVKTAGVMQVMRFLQEVLAMPEPGAYLYDFDEEYYWSFTGDVLPICEEEWAYESEEWCSDMNLELGDGRYFLSIYDVDSGYYFYDRLRWVGTFYDKLLALETMTNPDTFFLGVNSSESFDEWAISMYTTFPKEMQKLFSGIIGDRFDLFAGRVEETNWSYVTPDPFATGQAATDFDTYGPVDPSTSFTVQLYALWYGMAYLNANYDNTFNDGAKIWVVGAGEAIETVDPDRVITFANPFNHRVYATVKMHDTTADFAVGQTMIERANELLALYEDALADVDIDAETLDYYRWQVLGMTENIEVVRGLYDLYGYLYF